MSSFFDGITEFWREILVGSAVLFMLLVLGLLSYFFLSWLLPQSRMIDLEKKETQITTRHLLDLSEAERWRYIEAKHNGVFCCFECFDDDCKCQEVKNEMEMIKN